MSSSCHGNADNSDKHSKRSIDFLFWGSLIGVSTLFVLGLYFPQVVSALPWLETMAHTTHQMVHAMWWGVAIGALFIGILSKIPRDFIMSVLGKGGTLSGLFRATAAGVLLDLCSHGILMVGAKLYERGASAGQVIAFLLASPWNSFSLTLVLIGLIGLQWTLAFIALSMLIAITTGFVFDRLVDRGTLPRNFNTTSLPEDFEFWPEAKRGLARTDFDFRFFADLIVRGVTDSRMVVRWLLFGILLAGILRALLEPAQYVQLFGPTLVGLAITIFVATVLEVCSEGSTPVAADILTRAGAPGNSFAFLMAGVATDYTEVMVLKDTTRSWKLALFLPLIALPQIVVVAWFMNAY